MDSSITSQRLHKNSCTVGPVALSAQLLSVERLAAKLQAKGVHPRIAAVLVSWLRQRSSFVVVEGARSVEMLLSDMVYQGTVLGPILWNLFFEDARLAINEWLFEECV